MAEKIDDKPSCGGGIKTREIAISAKAIALANAGSIEKIKNRPPVWATAVISLLTFLLGCSVTYIGLLSRIAGR